MNPDEQELAAKRKSSNRGFGSCLWRTFTSWDFSIRDKEIGTPAWKTVYAVGVPHKHFQSRHFLKVTVCWDSKWRLLGIKCCECKINKNTQSRQRWHWREGSAVEIMYCSPRAPKFKSQLHIRRLTTTSTSSSKETQSSFLASVGLHTQPYTYKQTHKHK